MRCLFIDCALFDHELFIGGVLAGLAGGGVTTSLVVAMVVCRFFFFVDWSCLLLLWY